MITDDPTLLELDKMFLNELPLFMTSRQKFACVRLAEHSSMQGLVHGYITAAPLPFDSRCSQPAQVTEGQLLPPFHIFWEQLLTCDSWCYKYFVALRLSLKILGCGQVKLLSWCHEKKRQHSRWGHPKHLSVPVTSCFIGEAWPLKDKRIILCYYSYSNRSWHIQDNLWIFQWPSGGKIE